MLETFRRAVSSLGEDAIERMPTDVSRQAAIIILEDPDRRWTLKELAAEVSSRLGEEVSVPGLYQHLKKALREIGWLTEEQGGRRGRGQGGDQQRSGSQAAGSARKALESEYAEMIRALGEKARWFMDALTEIGFHATMAAFQFAKVPPEQFMEKARQFRDPQEFTSYVLEYLDAMLKAGSGAAERIVELEEENRRLQALLDLCTSLADELRSKLRKAVTYWRAAISLMDEEQLRRYMLAYALGEFISSTGEAPGATVEVSGGARP